MLAASTLDEQIEKLGGSGYATDSRYADKIKGIVKGKTLQGMLGQASPAFSNVTEYPHT